MDNFPNELTPLGWVADFFSELSYHRMNTPLTALGQVADFSSELSHCWTNIVGSGSNSSTWLNIMGSLEERTPSLMESGGSPQLCGLAVVLTAADKIVTSNCLSPPLSAL